MNDVRFVKDGVACALSRRCAPPGVRSRATAWLPLSAQMIGLRFTAPARAAGVESRVTAHSGRVGLALELTPRRFDHGRDARRELPARICATGGCVSVTPSSS